MLKKIIFVFAIVLILFSRLLGLSIASLFGLDVSDGIGEIVGIVIALLLVFISIKFIFEKALKIDRSKIGMPKFNIKPKWIAFGVLLPVAVMSICVFCFSGEFVSSDMSNKQIIERIIVVIICNGICAGFTEELLFRGILFNLLNDKWNKYVAIIVPSVLFAAAHLFNDNFSLVSCMLLMVAGTMVGIMFSAIMLESNSIWSSFSVHALWNIIIGGSIISISDKASDKAILTYVFDTKSKIITGGEFGIESSVISVVAYVIIAIIAVIMIKNNKKAKA